MTEDVKLSYGNHAKQGVDVFWLPQSTASQDRETNNEDTYLCLIFIHGGAWKTGDRSEFHDLTMPLKERMIQKLHAVAFLGYRLSGEQSNPIIHPDHINDVVAGIVTLVQYLDTTHAKGRRNLRLVLAGHSVGATLSFQCLPLLPELIQHRILGIMGIEGIYDIPLLSQTFPTYANWFLRLAFGIVSDETGSASSLGTSQEELCWRAASPMYHDLPHLRPLLDRNQRSVLIVHSAEDELVDVVQSERFAQRFGASYHKLDKGKHDEVLRLPAFFDVIGAWVKDLTH